MEMWRFDPAVVRVTMRPAAEIQSHENHGLSSTILVGAFLDIDPVSSEVKEEPLASIC